MLVRSATGADEAAVWPLARALATSYVPQREPFACSWRAILADPRAALLVAVDDGGGGGPPAVVGYVHVLVHPAFHANGDVAWVEELIVAAERRGSGCGRRLMAAAEAWAGERGAAYVAVATRRAAGFYAAIGYAESAAYLKRELPGATGSR